MLIVTEKSVTDFQYKISFCSYVTKWTPRFFPRRYLIREICIVIKRDPQKLSKKLTVHFMQQGYRVLKACFSKAFKETTKLYSTLC